MNYYLDVLKKYAEFDGRARRKEYWMFVLFNILILIALSLVDKMMDINILSTVYAFGVLLPSIAVGVRRLHDTSRSGWWMFISLIPFIGSLILLVFFVLDSTPGNNEYGPNPKGVAAATSAPATPTQAVPPPPPTTPAA